CGQSVAAALGCGPGCGGDTQREREGGSGEHGPASCRTLADGGIGHFSSFLELSGKNGIAASASNAAPHPPLPLVGGVFSASRRGDSSRGAGYVPAPAFPSGQAGAGTLCRSPSLRNATRGVSVRLSPANR